jgi:isopentenyl diphosphate isomerase/L-lactate dehydrogenase-like FMN-dependent dehydrogenase
VSLGTSFLGEPVPLPVFFSPTGQGRQGHPDGELNLTRGGSRSGGVPQGVSSAASVGIDEVCQERDSLAAQTGMTRVPIWWQLCESQTSCGRALV